MFMVGLVLRFWPEYVELQRLVASGELGRPRAVCAYRLSPPADWNDWMAEVAVGRYRRRPRDPRLRPAQLAARDAAHCLRARVDARPPCRGRRVRRASGVVEGSMLMPHSYPFSSNIRVLCEKGVAEYGFSAAPAEDGGNIGASPLRAVFVSIRRRASRRQWMSRAPIRGGPRSRSSSMRRATP